MSKDTVATAELNHGKGKSVVTGPVQIEFTDFNQCCVSTPAYHSDTRPAVTYRDRQWLVTACLERGEDGAWSATYMTAAERKRFQRGTDAPPTYRAAIEAAVVSAASRAWTEEIGYEAGRVKIETMLGVELQKQRKAREALSELDANVAALEEKLEAFIAGKSCAERAV
jgi:hypothetical protein